MKGLDTGCASSLCLQFPPLTEKGNKPIRLNPSRPSVSDEDEYLIYKDTQKALQFRYPKDWTVEELKEENVLLIMAPDAEANWQTNVLIEIREQTEAALPLEEELNALLIHFPDYKEGFTFKSRDVINTTTGLTAGVLTYEHDPEIGLFEKEYVIPWNDNKMQCCMLPVRPSSHCRRSTNPRSTGFWTR